MMIHPTRSESFGQVMAEAAALGIPSVASDVNGVPEVVLEGETGLLCPVGDVAAFTHALTRLMTDEGLRRGLGGDARKRAADLYRWSKVAARIEEEIYRPLIG